MSDPWVGREPSHDSPYYPFIKSVEAPTMAGSEQMAYMLARYLMDLPDGTGYQPPEDNSFPRARIKKILYWDEPLPLEKPLPTAEQIRSLLFDPLRPADPPDKERGYRIYLQEFVSQAQYQSQTRLHIYPNNVNDMSASRGGHLRQSMIIKITCNYALNTNIGSTASSRAKVMEQAVIEAINGVSFGGVGALRVANSNKIDDERVNDGFKIYCNVDWVGDAPNPFFAVNAES